MTFGVSGPLENNVMTSTGSGPRVLAITRDRAFLRALRLEMPLFNLKKQKLVDDYFITDPSLFDVPDSFTFDVVWLQRCNDPKLLDLLDKKIGCDFIYDLDDLLIGRADYREDSLTHKDVILTSIKRCKVLTVSSMRLGRLLEAYTGAALAHKIVVCPNALEFPPGSKTPMRPSGLIVTSSESLALSESLSEVFNGVADFVKRQDLPVYYFGPRNDFIHTTFPKSASFGLITFWHYHAILASLPPMIGLAPLETQGDQSTLDFVSGKSDIKMVDFGGSGHPSVYSKAAPYVDTDLKAGLTVENRAQDWRYALEEIHSDLWRNLDAEQREIVRLRDMDRIASGSWLGALNRAKLPERLSGRDIRFSSCSVSFFTAAAKHMVFSQDHIFLKRLQERMPPLTMRALRKFILNA